MAITDRAMAITAARPMSLTTITAAAPGSGSVSGMGMAGGFAVSGCAADPVHLHYKAPGCPSKQQVSRWWPEKTFFSGDWDKGVYFRLTVVRFLAKRPVSNTACELS